MKRIVMVLILFNTLLMGNAVDLGKRYQQKLNQIGSFEAIFHLEKVVDGVV